MKNEELIEFEALFISKAKEYAINCHNGTNHKYDGKPYETHLQMVVDCAYEFIHLVDEPLKMHVIASAWTHDVIEDCRETFNDVGAVLGLSVAELVYAVTNEKGRTRQERANNVYYQGIRDCKYAGFVKLCDRIANVRYSKEQGSRMFDLYKKEHRTFKAYLSGIGCEPLWDELDRLFS